ncbi:MAG: hypothetical protein ACO2PP_14095 [Thermocrinis sp.]|jgi:hypothetical protein|uniref:hypothetical protein n=1 Tax=Thermocrinis sp. TaxID=2024383 RepID=UPI003C034AD7
MRVLDFFKSSLEDFFGFAKEVDKEFLPYIEKEELYEGLKKAQELKARQQEPLKKLYYEWVEEVFRFLIERVVYLNKFPYAAFLRASGLIKAKGVIMKEKMGEEERELHSFIVDNLAQLCFYRTANQMYHMGISRGDVEVGFHYINPNKVEDYFDSLSEELLDGECVVSIPTTLLMKVLYEMFPENNATFSRILSDRLSQAIEKGYPEKHTRVIQTAIAVIKNDPESLPKGEPKSFAEKWLREELVV